MEFIKEEIQGLSSKRVTKRYRALGTNIDLTVFGTKEERFLDEAFSLIMDYEDRLTVNRAESEMMSVNDMAGVRPVSVSPSTYSLVKKAIELSQQEYGFNTFIGPVVKLWSIGFKNAGLPSDSAISEKLHNTDPFQVSLNDKNQSIFLKKSGMEIDLGAIAKGYIADRIRDLWHSYGIEAGMINLGGNLLMVGDSPTRDDRLWRIGIQNPYDKRGDIIASVTIQECSAVTSGIYERYLEVDGKTYHHIIDAKTGYPHNNDLASVTVFSKDSIDGEIETTRLFFADGPQLDWNSDRSDLYGAIFVTKDKKILLSGINRDSVTLLNDEFAIVD